MAPRPGPDAGVAGVAGVADPAGLYRVEPGQFTEARNLLVKRLKAGGQRAEAERVAKLRRPSVTAWALNQMAHEQPQLIDAVLVTGNDLRSAMEQAVGGDASGLRQAQAANRRAVDAAATAAGTYLLDAGHAAGDQAMPRMVATLTAAVVDEAVASQLRAGFLDVDHSAPGFGLDAASVSLVVPAATSGPGDDTGDTMPAESTESDASRLRDEADRLTGRADRLGGEAKEAERDASRARAAAEEAGRKAKDARAAADQAGRLAQQARDRAEQAGAPSKRVRKRS